jgi:hypothetical protein
MNCSYVPLRAVTFLLFCAELHLIFFQECHTFSSNKLQPASISSYFTHSTNWTDRALVLSLIFRSVKSTDFEGRAGIDWRM